MASSARRPILAIVMALIFALTAPISFVTSPDAQPWAVKSIEGVASNGVKESKKRAAPRTRTKPKPLLGYMYGTTNYKWTYVPYRLQGKKTAKR
mmetsp:Transcript_70273/g.124110  ORF Transcript_70273/g.124110 Transcript_70273/m.124110 type:complete len:94 (-) Transcript_70273:80-361(-)